VRATNEERCALPKLSWARERNSPQCGVCTARRSSRAYPTTCTIVGYVAGTPGNLTQRTNESGTKFWVHRYSDAVGRRQETYLGTNDDQAVLARLESLRKRIEEANATIARVRVLARAGFATVDRKTYSALAAFHNHGLFRRSEEHTSELQSRGHL